MRIRPLENLERQAAAAVIVNYRQSILQSEGRVADLDRVAKHAAEVPDSLLFPMLNLLASSPCQGYREALLQQTIANCVNNGRIGTDTANDILRRYPTATKEYLHRRDWITKLGVYIVIG